ncbi:hypothetical protein [Streptomyces sp. BF23-19]|uniref:hypothetical protein n=1 Tax=unclassified Streptomyces TaxID=2593676 RepID=UPI0034E3B330
MTQLLRTRRLALLVASTAVAAGGVLVPTTAFAATPTAAPHAVDGGQQWQCFAAPCEAPGRDHHDKWDHHDKRDHHDKWKHHDGKGHHHDKWNRHDKWDHHDKKGHHGKKGHHTKWNVRIDVKL